MESILIIRQKAKVKMKEARNIRKGVEILPPKKLVQNGRKVTKFPLLFSCYSYLVVTLEICRYLVTLKVTSYSNAVTCNALL